MNSRSCPSAVATVSIPELVPSMADGMLFTSFEIPGQLRQSQTAVATGALAPAATPGDGVPTILESKEIKVTLDDNDDNQDNFIKGISVCCNSWLCEKCRRAKGFELRKKLIAKVAMFKQPRLYTVTINRDWFQSPEDAYHYVMGEKFLARLLTKEMGVRRWVWVLEAQEESGDGWPHWHILIDVADLPGQWYNKAKKQGQTEKPDDVSDWCYVSHFFDLNRVHHLLRKWKIGEQCKLTVKRDNFANSEHAIFYITKYLIKAPRRGFPPWMLQTRNLRFYQPSHEVGKMSTEDKKTPQKEPDKKLRPPVVRVPVDRIAECRKKVLFIRYDARREKYKVVSLLWGIKESIPKVAGAVSMPVFNQDKLQVYPVWGFPSLLELKNFQKLWNEPTLKNELDRVIMAKREKLLAQWGQSAA